MHNIKRLISKPEALLIVKFFLSRDAFTHKWAPGEKDIVRKAPFDSLVNFHHAYWYIEEGGKIIGAIGVRENEYKSGGYELADDFFAVHIKFRRKGIGSLLFSEMEKYVKKNNGRYIHILSCDTDLYSPARKFYEKMGYKKVLEIPDYYVIGEGRVDYYKKLS